MMYRILLILAIALTGSGALAQNVDWKVKAYEGTFFYGHFYPLEEGIVFFGGVTEGDTTVIDITDASTLFESIYRHAVYAQASAELVYQALCVIYPDDDKGNWKVAERVKNFEFVYEVGQNKKSFSFELKTGESGFLYYVRIKGLYLSFPGSKWWWGGPPDDYFEHIGCDVYLKDTLMFLNGFEYSESDHQFIVRE